MANDTKGKAASASAIPQHKKLAMGLPVNTGAGMGGKAMPKTPA
jgi:hypothetical protein